MGQVTTSLDTLFAKLGSDDLAALQPLADNYLTTVAANTGLITDEAQTVAFIGQVGAALPVLEQTDVKDTALALKSLLDLEVASAQAALNPAPAPTVTPPATA